MPVANAAHFPDPGDGGRRRAVVRANVGHGGQAAGIRGPGEFADAVGESRQLPRRAAGGGHRPDLAGNIGFRFGFRFGGGRAQKGQRGPVGRVAGVGVRVAVGKRLGRRRGGGVSAGQVNSVDAGAAFRCRRVNPGKCVSGAAAVGSHGRVAYHGQVAKQVGADGVRHSRVSRWRSAVGGRQWKGIEATYLGVCREITRHSGASCNPGVLATEQAAMDTDSGCSGEAGTTKNAFDDRAGGSPGRSQARGRVFIAGAMGSGRSGGAANGGGGAWHRLRSHRLPGWRRLP